MKTDLTPRQETFCREVAAGKSGSNAARLSGYKNVGVAQTRLLKHRAIRERINHLCRESIKRCEIDLDIIAEELLAIATGPSMGTYIDQTEDGLVWKEQLSETQQKMIRKSITIKDVLNHYSFIELHSKTKR